MSLVDEAIERLHAARALLEGPTPSTVTNQERLARLQRLETLFTIALRAKMSTQRAGSESSFSSSSASSVPSSFSKLNENNNLVEGPTEDAASTDPRTAMVEEEPTTTSSLSPLGPNIREDGTETDEEDSDAVAQRFVDPFANDKEPSSSVPPAAVSPPRLAHAKVSEHGREEGDENVAVAQNASSKHTTTAETPVDEEDEGVVDDRAEVQSLTQEDLVTCEWRHGDLADDGSRSSPLNQSSFSGRLRLQNESPPTRPSVAATPPDDAAASSRSFFASARQPTQTPSAIPSAQRPHNQQPKGSPSLAPHHPTASSSMSKSPHGGLGSPSATSDTPPMTRLQQNLHEYPILAPPPWTPPRVALFADVLPPGETFASEPTVHQVILYAKTVMRKPKGFHAKDEAIREQGLYCKGCLTPLKASFSALRLGKSWDCAKFCYYTGYYYCKNCHPCTDMAILPARILTAWDFTPLSVCQPAHCFLETHHTAPVLCVSAVNPRLYEKLLVLRSARLIRVQLHMLREIGSRCPDFCQEFFGRSGNTTTATATSAAHHLSPRGGGGLSLIDDMVRSANRRYGTQLDNTYHSWGGHCIPVDRRYLVDDTEFWSLADLQEIKATEDALNRTETETRKTRDEYTIDPLGRLQHKGGGGGGTDSPRASVDPHNSRYPQHSSSSPFGMSSRTINFTDVTHHSPTTAAAATAAAGGVNVDTVSMSELLSYLKQLRAQMVRHVLHTCKHNHNPNKETSPVNTARTSASTVAGDWFLETISSSGSATAELPPYCCYRAAVRICPLCPCRTSKDFVFEFDLSRTRTCHRCGTSYHRTCWAKRSNKKTECVICAKEKRLQEEARRKDLVQEFHRST